MLADEYALASFFDRRLPASVVSGATFETWRKGVESGIYGATFKDM